MKTINFLASFFALSFVLLIATTSVADSQCNGCDRICVRNSGPCGIDVIIETTCGQQYTISNLAAGTTRCVSPPVDPCCITQVTVQSGATTNCTNVDFSVTCTVGNTCALPSAFTSVTVRNCRVLIQ